jgi:hypothetical protein
MNFITRTALINAIVVITVVGVLHAQTDGAKIGVVSSIDLKTAEIIVRSPAAVNDMYMGDLLYLRIDGKIILLRVTFPMQTVSKCKAEGKNRALWVKVGKGMTVYRYREGIEDKSTGEAENTEDPRDKTYKGSPGAVIKYDLGE